MSGSTQRRLAAIVSVDVVGYSRLMGVDETGTLAALRAHRSELIDPKIAEHGGRIVKTMGDGLLLEFPSVVNATRCALAVQEGMAARNADVPDDKRIAFRIGINLGDIIIEGEDILGDGVNIAARLEQLAEPGGVCISNRVHEDVQDRLDASFEDAGEQSLKNIARPVQVWRWSPVGTPTAAAAETVSHDALPLPDKPSIAVLPFENMSGDPEHEFFADGISEDIITALSKLSRMRVIARTSTFAYKGQATDLRKVAGDLGVRYVLEGSVRSGGNRLRITAQLIDASDGSHIWAERFDRTPDDLFDIQDEITKEIVTALRVHLTDGEEAAILARGTNDIEAWQLCMRASELQMKFNATDYLEARALAERALARDPNYAYAWGTLGFTYWWDGRLGFTGDSAAKFARAAECAERAMAIDDTVSWAICLSVMAAAPLGRQEEALEMARRGIAHHPGNADVRAILAYALIHAGHYEDSLEHFRAAMALNPFHPNWYRTGFARALMFLDQMEAALAPIEEIMASEPSNLQAWLMRGYIYGRTGRVDEARADVDRARRLAPDLRVGNLTGLLLIGDEESAERFRAGLSAIGLPE